VLSATVEALEVCSHDRVETARLRLPDGRALIVRPKFVVVAAGVGHRSVLETLRFDDALKTAEALVAAKKARAEDFERLQTVKKPHLVCIRGPASLLPAGCLWLQSVPMIVVAQSDYVTDSSGEKKNVWFLTPQDPKLMHVADKGARRPGSAEAPVEDATVQLAVKAALSLLPLLKANASQLEWGAYAGFSAEPPTMEPQALPCVGVTNLLVAYPVLAAASIRTAQIVVEKVHNALGKPSAGAEAQSALAAQVKPLQSVRVGRMEVERVKFTSFEEFLKRYHVTL